MEGQGVGVHLAVFEEMVYESRKTACGYRAVLVTFLALSGVVVLHAQRPGAKRTILSRQDLSSFSGHEGVVALLELVPGALEPKHTHPGDLFGYIQEGTLTLSVEGKPTVTVKPGEVFYVPAGKVHWGENAGTTPIKVLATFVVEKDKPLTSPAP